MARPKNDKDSVSARERIENAFWRLLETHPYDKLTIKMLATEADVNHNLIYYYYKNLDDVAIKAFQHNMKRDLPQILLMSMTEPETAVSLLQNNPLIQLQFDRVSLLASSNSTFLTEMLKEGLKQIWLSQAGKTPEELSEMDILELEFIFSAIIAVIKVSPRQGRLELMKEFLNDPLGKAVLATLNRIVHI